MNSRAETSICLFGPSPVLVDGYPCRLGISGTTEKPFQFLLVNAGKVNRREYLADLFWRINRQLQGHERVEPCCDGPAIYVQIEDSVSVDACELAEVRAAEFCQGCQADPVMTAGRDIKADLEKLS